MHVLLAIRDPRAAASAARALRNTGVIVDIARDTSIASAMLAGGAYSLVVCDQGLGSGLRSPVKLLEIGPADAADLDAFVVRVRASAQEPSSARV